ncbi:MAG: hypothetical protein ACP5Q5_06905 [Brevinematia bacterium]
MKKLFLSLIFFLIIIYENLFSLSINSDYGIKNDLHFTIGGSINIGLFPLPFYKAYNGIGWFSLISSSYKYIYDGDHNNLISIYPTIAWTAIGWVGFDIAVEPIFNINKLNFDRFRLKLGGSVFFVHASIYGDIIYYPKSEWALGINVGIGMPPWYPDLAVLFSSLFK